LVTLVLPVPLGDTEQIIDDLQRVVKILAVKPVGAAVVETGQSVRADEVPGSLAYLVVVDTHRSERTEDGNQTQADFAETARHQIIHIENTDNS
jgi:hypothetical protein